MADLFHTLTSGEIALVAGVAKTVLMLTAPANHRVRVQGIAAYFKDVVTTDVPVLIEIGRCTTAGTSTAQTPKAKDDSLPETIQSVGGKNFTVEPTYTDILETLEIHPQTGIKSYFPLGQEYKIKGGGRLGIRMTATQNQTVALTLDAEE